MKNLSLSVLLVLLVQHLTLCQENTQGIREDLIKKIALDQDYIQYQSAVLESSYHIAIGSWDREQIVKLMEKYPDLESHCVFPDDELALIKGGLMWKETYCNVYSRQKKIRNKYNAHNLTPQDWEKVQGYYMEVRGKKDIEDMGDRIFSNH